MKIEDQVLSIEQVQELQELGFDVKKNASMVWINNRLFSKDDTTTQCMVVQVDYISTMTIGDIIDVLPERIHKNYYLEIGKNYVDYSDDHFSINGEVEYKLIDALFEMLKWYIKEKQIKQ